MTVTSAATPSVTAVASSPPLPPTPALYPTRVSHLHRSPIQHYGEHRSYSWLVDLDDLPVLPRWLRPFARFEARDHFRGHPGDTLRQRVDAVLAGHGLYLPGGRVVALLMPRVLGRSFNPLSLFWCHDREGTLRCVVAEVQTIRGETHAYVLPPSGENPAAVIPAAAGRPDNTPFAGDSGYFLVRAPIPDAELDLSVTLSVDSHTVMMATWSGRRHRVNAARVVLTQLSTPLAPQMAELAMRLQATMLRLRGVPQAPTAGLPSRRPVPGGWAPPGRTWAAS